MIVFKTKNLTKKYGKKAVLDQVNMEIKQGEIYGFIGLNGAGKSTMMRVIMGLTNVTTGDFELFGVHERKQLNQVRKRIGSLVENPALFPNLNGRQNLEVIRIQRGIPNKEVITRMLELVGLKDASKKKVKNYSLGMKQRLGIAIALLHNPEFLILDEPTNGLDPKGVIEIRELLKKINQEQQVTILISSHILSEVHQLATRIGIIHQGKLLEEITASELEEKCRAHLLLKTDDVEKTAAVLEAELETANFQVMPNETIQLYSHLHENHKIGKLLSEHGIIVEQMMLNNETLEDYFSSVVEGVMPHE